MTTFINAMKKPAGEAGDSKATKVIPQQQHSTTVDQNLNSAPVPDLTEARRLHAAGFKLCKLQPNSKRPVGDGWNSNPITQFDDRATGYGIMLYQNGLCSVDPDNAPLAAKMMAALGFDLDAIMAAGVRNISTRPGSGGRSAFRATEGLKWITFSFYDAGTVLELRAASENLQDVIPGLVYADKTGELRTQSYLNCKRLDEAPDLPADLLAFWQRMATDLEFRRQQQHLAGETLGLRPMRSVSAGGKLAFASPNRVEFNRHHKVEEMLPKFRYTRHGKRFSRPGAEGGPGIRQIKGKDDLWQSDHGGDPLQGTFDAWTVFVLFEHADNVEAAEAAWMEKRSALILGECEPIVDDDDEPQRAALPGFLRTNKGEAEATINNLLMALPREDLIGQQIAFDTFRDQIMLAPPDTDDQWRPLTDDDYTALRAKLEQRGGLVTFKPISKELFRDAVSLISKRNQFDSGIKWIESLAWDGVPRIDTFLPRYMGTNDTPYTRAVGAYLWTALAGRLLEPGIKADMVPVAVGAQGAMKSSAAAAIVPDAEFFTELNLAEQDKERAYLIRGKLICELAELKGLRSSESEHIKAAITKTHEEWRLPYTTVTVRYARRCVFFGTSNDDEFLADDTGHRRWLPFKVSECDPNAIAADRAQLWAEARGRFLVEGIAWEVVEHLARAEHEQYLVTDTWGDTVSEWLDQLGADGIRNRDHRPLTSEYILRFALLFDSKQIEFRHKRRLVSVMKALGYVQKTPKIAGKTTKVWEGDSVPF